MMNGCRRMNQNLMNELYKIVGEQNVRMDEPMSRHTTFRIGGPAQVFVTPQTAEELGQVVLSCNAYKVPFFMLGHGSNLLVRDGWGCHPALPEFFGFYNRWNHSEGTGRGHASYAGKCSAGCRAYRI